MRKEIFESEDECIQILSDIGLAKASARAMAEHFNEKGYIKKSIDEIYAEFCQCEYIHEESRTDENNKWADKACEYIEALEKEIDKLRSEENDNNR